MNPVTLHQADMFYAVLVSQASLYFCIAILWTYNILKKIRESKEETLLRLRRIELTLSQLQRDLEPKDKIPSKY